MSEGDVKNTIKAVKNNTTQQLGSRSHSWDEQVNTRQQISYDSIFAIAPLDLPYSAAISDSLKNLLIFYFHSPVA